MHITLFLQSMNSGIPMVTEIVYLLHKNIDS